MRNAKLPLLAVSVLLLLLGMLASSVQSRQAPPCSPGNSYRVPGVRIPELELNDLDKKATRGGINMRRLQTVRPSPLGYPPPPTVAGPQLPPSPSPSAI